MVRARTREIVTQAPMERGLAELLTLARRQARGSGTVQLALPTSVTEQVRVAEGPEHPRVWASRIAILKYGGRSAPTLMRSRPANPYESLEIEPQRHLTVTRSIGLRGNTAELRVADIGLWRTEHHAIESIEPFRAEGHRQPFREAEFLKQAEVLIQIRRIS